MLNKLWFTYLLAFIAMSFWGFSFVWVKIAYEYLTPFTLLLLRLSISTALLSVVLHFCKKEKLQKGDLVWFILLALFEPFCYFMGESFGMLYVSATLASLIISTIPLLTPVFSYFWLKEKVSLLSLVGIVISFIGVSLIILDDWNIQASLKGVLLMFVAVLGGTNYAVVLKKVAHKYSALFVVRTQNLLGMIYFLPFFLFYDLSKFHTIVPDFRLVWTIICLSVFASTVAFLLFTVVIQRIGVNRTNVFTNLIPIITAVTSYFVLGEGFSIEKIVGMVVVLAGLFLAQSKSLRIFVGLFRTKREK